MSFFFPIPKSVKTPSVAGHKKKIQDFLLYLFFSCTSFSIAETGFEPALPTSKSGRPLSLSAFCLRNSRFLACITFLLLPLAAVGAAAPETRRSQGIKKDTRFSLVSLFLIAETDSILYVQLLFISPIYPRTPNRKQIPNHNSSKSALLLYRHSKYA